MPPTWTLPAPGFILKAIEFWISALLEINCSFDDSGEIQVLFNDDNNTKSPVHSYIAPNYLYYLYKALLIFFG